MERVVTYVTVALTVAMIMLGAVVHGTGSSRVPGLADVL